MNKNLIYLAISMTEIDAGIELSTEERRDMFNRILARIKNLEQQDN
jgi:hypothetical protein